MKSIETQASQGTAINSSANIPPSLCATKEQRDGDSAHGNRAIGIQKSGNPFLRSAIRDPRSAIITAAAFLAIICAVGCHTGTLEDPNDVPTAGPDTADVIMRQLTVASDSLNARRERGEIGERRYRALITNIARDYVSQAKDTTLNNKNARTWAQIYKTARDWKKAEEAFVIAVKVDKDASKEDFNALGLWVGDTMELAGAQAHLGNVHEAVETARSVFSAPPKAKVPILTSVLYDVVPVSIGHGADLELAKLLEDAIKQHEEVIVDPSTDGGRNFLLARPHHIQRAWEEAQLLYETAGRHDLALKALQESQRVKITGTKV